jgi:type II secretory pathway component GspD/PulD (secretin)
MRKQLYIYAGGVVILLFVIIMYFARAQEGTAVKTSDKADVSNMRQETRQVSSSVVAEGGTVTVRFTDEPLNNVIALFTRTLGVNILASNTDLENKRVTVNLTGVEWKSALSAILAMHDLMLVEQMPGSKVYLVVPRRLETEEQMVVETIRLNYITTSQAKQLLVPLLTTNATFLDFASGNAIVVRTTPSNLMEIRKVLAELDAPGKQICVEAKFMELSDQASRQLGIDWQALEALTLQGKDVGLDYSKTLRRTSMDERGNVNVRRDNRASELEFDVKGENVRTLEVDREGTITRTSVLPVERTEIRAAVLGIDDFKIILSALNKLEGVSLISNPKIIVASGSTNAFFSIGNRLPIIKSTRTIRGIEEGITDIVLELDTAVKTDYIEGGYLKTGIELRVIPTAKTNDLIEARIQPKLIRELPKTPEQIALGIPWPSISVKELDTTFTLKNGQTVAIGGLTSTTDAERSSKIPLLGSIPLVGRLFSYKYTAREQVETIIFVTLSLVPSESIRDTAGIPQNAELVHKELIRSRAREEKSVNEEQSGK